VDTWNSRRASSTWLSRANGARDILVRDSEMRTMASSCLQGERVCHSTGYTCSYKYVWIEKMSAIAILLQAASLIPRHI
jgi:hypothetical protein